MHDYRKSDILFISKRIIAIINIIIIVNVLYGVYK